MAKGGLYRWIAGEPLFVKAATQLRRLATGGAVAGLVTGLAVVVAPATAGAIPAWSLVSSPKQRDGQQRA